MDRIEKPQKRVNKLYQTKNQNRADWADWLCANHVFIVAELAGSLASRFGAKKELAMAAGMLHDVADAVMSREDSRHEEESFNIARTLLHDAGFSDEESRVIVDDAIKWHGCRNRNYPTSLEGKVMATADALGHLKTDFYPHAVKVLRSEKTLEEIKNWALPKIERDFNDKIFFSDVQQEVRPDYERLKDYFSKELR